MLQEVGKPPLNQSEIYWLYETLLGEYRFKAVGCRSCGVFVGDRDHVQQPSPEYIGAQAEQVPDLMRAQTACNNRLSGMVVDAVIHAAAIACGFVDVHAGEDGNGRL
jgi:hypothetical protein